MRDLFALGFSVQRRLAFPVFVVADYRVRRVQDGLCGTVILLQPDHLGVGKRFFKAQDVFDGRTAELVNALVVVAHDAEVAGSLSRQQLDQQVLRVAGVLIFVDQDVAETVLVMFQHVRALLEQLHGLKIRSSKSIASAAFSLDWYSL